MEKQPSAMDTIHMLYDTFFEQEKKIANYILKHHKEVVNMTIVELSKACGTSVATISRFCKKCGLEGFHHLKIGLAKEIASNDTDIPVSNTISRDDIDQSLQNILANKIEELKQTVSMLDADQLNQVLDAIKNADTVQLVAAGNTIPVALDGAYKLNQIGIKTMAGTILETQLAFALSLKKGDVLIAISNSGESRRVYKMVKEAKRRGVIIVAITNNPNSTIGSDADYCLQTATREKLFLNEFYFSRVSATVVIEILYLFLTVGQKESYENVRTVENLIADEKI
ncbi:MAG: MurR/RpiR family transcriptional regulator [Anaerostipes sp.]|uniref:MurR/RpiR family transcriptional regulator n=1 Tax=Anaerostipes sp. 992a TaxID=1261637 RepID=UPI0009524EC7|nr:MurR/RpiR family transcriptional regulator [Anaerostipes sp. 992a]MCI5952272.1 MurR/RpiR family transcriptional regulator [Anaerostipes sp.]MDD5969968.1 MurR/RpiR family transcriptional regulator [Anaerostipes sp.]OLR58096.1 RpiR family transcriptional regulator [Anaerostipes sp. 992a]